jgi:hypothetical protein
LPRAIFSEVLDKLCHLNRRIEKLDAKMAAICRTNPVAYCSQRGSTLGRSSQQRSSLPSTMADSTDPGRELSAWIGLGF